MLTEFRNFIMRGNVLDLAVGIIIGAAALSRNAVGLARIARSDAIHDSAPWARIEGSKIRPDRRRMQPPIFHARRKDCGRIGFTFDVTNAARAAFGNADSKFEAANPGT